MGRHAGESSVGELLEGIYRMLYTHFGPQHWWPGETPEEIAVGAILTQNTNWQNVAKAIANLKDAGCLSLKAIAEMDGERLKALIRPAGYYNVKAQRLQGFAKSLLKTYPEGLRQLFGQGLDEARSFLLSLKGIGPETADSILLYAGGLPTFVVDAYTIRVLQRHSIIDDEAGYQEVQELFMDHLPQDVELFNEFHALFVALGKNHCRKRRPLCEGCPLEGI